MFSLYANRPYIENKHTASLYGLSGRVALRIPLLGGQYSIGADRQTAFLHWASVSMGVQVQGVGVQNHHFGLFGDMYPLLHPSFALAVNALTRTNAEPKAL